LDSGVIFGRVVGVLPAVRATGLFTATCGLGLAEDGAGFLDF